MGIVPEEARIFSAQIDHVLEIRAHRGKVVRRARLRPRMVGGRADCVGALDMARGHLADPFELAPRHGDQPRVVAIGRQAFAIGDERIKETSERRAHHALMRDPAHARVLTRA